MCKPGDDIILCTCSADIEIRNENHWVFYKYNKDKKEYWMGVVFGAFRPLAFHETFDWLHQQLNSANRFDKTMQFHKNDLLIISIYQSKGKRPMVFDFRYCRGKWLKCEIPIFFPENGHDRLQEGPLKKHLPSKYKMAKMETGIELINYCKKCMNDGGYKEAALVKAKLAHQWWIALETKDGHLPSQEEIQDALDARQFAYMVIASVYLWNSLFREAFELENEFLFVRDEQDQEYENQVEAIGTYLSLLIVFHQSDHLNEIFENKIFLKTFLAYQDVMHSVKNPNYYFKSKNSAFVMAVNKTNGIARTLTGSQLF